MTLEEIQLMVIKKVSEIAEAVPQPSGKFFYYDDTGVLKKSPMTEIYNLVSGSQSLGTITTASTIPAEGNVWAFAAPGTYPNAGNLTVSPNTVGILTRVGTTWSKVEVAMPNAVDNVTANGTTAVNSKAVIDYAEPKDFYPFESKPISEIQQKAANAVKELYISDYDVNFDYYLVALGRARDLTQYGYPPNRYGFKVVKKHKTDNTISDEQFSQYDRPEPLGDDFLQSNNKTIYMIVDWKVFNISEGLDVNYAEAYKLDTAVGDIMNSPRIATEIQSLNPDFYTKTETDATFLKKNEAPQLPADILTETDGDQRYQPKSAAAYSMAQSDSRYVLSGSVSGSTYQVINAADFGFHPSNTAAQNVTAMQNAIAGGNKTVIVTIPGEYAMKEGVEIEDNTEITFHAGTFVKLTENTWNIFINKGAKTRNYNYNIRLSGVKFKVNGFKAYPNSAQELFGMRGLVNFFYVKNLHVSDIECLDINDTNWPLHIAKVEDVVIERLKFVGDKDGLHVGTCKRVVVRDYYSSCYDDTFGLNPFDYPESNPEIGDIEDFYIDGVYWLHGGFSSGGRIINLQLGTVGDLTVGTSVQRGDAFNYDGKTYICVATSDGSAKTCNVLPTISVFNNNQLTADGIYWRLQKNGTSGSATVKNLVVRNMKIKNDSQYPVLICKYFSGQDGTFSRTIHPTIPVADYPEVTATFENITLDGYGYFGINEKLGHKTILRNIRGIKGNGNYPTTRFVYSANTQKKSNLNIKDCDFTEYNRELQFGTNTEVVISDNLQANFLNVLSALRINGNTNVNFTPTSPQKGDEFILNGTKKIYNGTAWVNLN